MIFFLYLLGWSYWDLCINLTGNGITDYSFYFPASPLPYEFRIYVSIRVHATSNHSSPKLDTYQHQTREFQETTIILAYGVSFVIPAGVFWPNSMHSYEHLPLRRIKNRAT
jgi:hypothetical protein